MDVVLSVFVISYLILVKSINLLKFVVFFHVDSLLTTVVPAVRALYAGSIMHHST